MGSGGFDRKGLNGDRGRCPSARGTRPPAPRAGAALRTAPFAWRYMHSPAHTCILAISLPLGCTNSSSLHYSYDYSSFHRRHDRRNLDARKPALLRALCQSGRGDLNPGPPEPHSGALPDCATPRCTGAKIRECAGDRYHAGLRPPHLSCTLWSLVRVGQSRSAASAGTQCSESPGAP